MAVSPLITKGFGPTTAIITQGFAPPEAQPTPAVVLQLLHGVDASIRTKRDWESPHVKKPWIDTFVISATLRSINGDNVENLMPVTVQVIDDSRDVFQVKSDRKITVNKTMPDKSIIIKVLSFFKRQ